MPIVATELKNYRSVNVSESTLNGGLMSNVEVISGVSSNLFANASMQDRSNGGVYYRKMFFKVANIDNLPLIKPRIWQDSNTEGMDRVTFFPASQRNTQGNITGFERQFGLGSLAIGIVANSQTLEVEVEHGPTEIFRNGDLIRISDRVTPMDPGNESWVRIDQPPSVTGNLVTLHVESPIPNDYLSGTKVSSVYEASDIVASAIGMSVSSSAGSIASPWNDHVIVNGIGAIEQNWTVTFVSATAFNITGDTVGAVGSGNITTPTAPTNPGLTQPFFRINSSLFTGTFVAGDSITFTTKPSATAIFLKRVIPAGTLAVSNNRVDLFIDGETI